MWKRAELPISNDRRGIGRCSYERIIPKIKAEAVHHGEQRLLGRQAVRRGTCETSALATYKLDLPQRYVDLVPLPQSIDLRDWCHQSSGRPRRRKFL
jgi:hypothetical protein